VGLERNAAALFLKMHADGARFGRVATLGRQHAHLDIDTYNKFLTRLGRPQVDRVPMFAEDAFAALGAASVDSIDASAYQQATIVHDLNRPLPPELSQRFDVVFDGGTLEHVFDIGAALRNCMELVRPGGRFVSATIANNWCGHGFYQFSPELFYRALGAENGFSVVEMYMIDVGGRRCYRVHDPATVGDRVELCNGEPIYLLVHARRDAVREIFSAMPQQSDYVRDWSGPQAGTEVEAGAPARRAAWKSLPIVSQMRLMRQRFLQRRRRRVQSFANRRAYTPADLRI